ncbi:MAG: DNA methyltransferase [Thermomicrobiales bacterium]
MSSMPTLVDYDAFLASKRAVAEPAGFAVDVEALNPTLFPFQRDIVTWALQRGRAAIFADCGLGKTRIQLEWARHVSWETGGNVLILTPLAVAAQTEAESREMGLDWVCGVARDQSGVVPGITITNYERLHLFDPASFTGIVLDESSILKAFDGKMRADLTAFAQTIPYRLCCTATPAPNDLVELTNHAQFLDIMSGKEIIALFFTQDGNTTHAWRLKGHARRDFWRWMASWSVAIRRPSDIGHDDTGFTLPPMHMRQHTVDVEPGFETLIPRFAETLQERQRARRESTADRVAMAADLVNASDQPWVVWCDLNAESEALAKAIPDAVEVRGSDTIEHKEQALAGFADGSIRVLVTKPTIAGYGMNWQHCAHMAFVGLSDSYEQQYQAIRRCWRFGQTRPVEVHVITAVTEGAVVHNIERKERQAAAMMDGIVEHMKAGLGAGPGALQAAREEMTYREDVASGRGWDLYLGDSVRVLADPDRIPDDTVGLAIFSPPFPGMYAYTNSTSDMGNVTELDEMIEHFRFLLPGLHRVMMPGRMVCVHLVQLTAMKSRDGYIGLKDYRGRVIDLFGQQGFNYAGEVTIEKNPQIQAVRNKERGLLFKSLATDASVMRMALADYLIYFRLPGENAEPIRAGQSPKYNADGGWITEQEWIEWASPVWFRHRAGQPGGIRETDVLNVVQARETDDERHLAPLQLGVIERAVKLWSNPGDLVLDPFNGIGSTGHEAIRLGRRYVGIELKESYWRTAQENLKRAEHAREQGSLFATSGVL